MPWGLSCQSAGVIKIALCAKYRDTKIELVEVEKTRRPWVLRALPMAETWKSSPMSWNQQEQ
jgi:hypothetical protein